MVDDIVPRFFQVLNNQSFVGKAGMVGSNMYLHAEILAEKESGRGALGTRALILKGEII
jgi:hypothetical protein